MAAVNQSFPTLGSASCLLLLPSGTEETVLSGVCEYLEWFKLLLTQTEADPVTLSSIVCLPTSQAWGV